jgi:hypothetical protein
VDCRLSLEGWKSRVGECARSKSNSRDEKATHDPPILDIISVGTT